MIDPAAIAFDERGLVPCVVQDWRTRRGADARLHERGRARAHRRRAARRGSGAARGRAVAQGRDRGNVQAVRELRYDCDADALLALVEPAGPACHTGERTCFHNGELDPPAPHEALPALERTIAERAAAADPRRQLHGPAAGRSRRTSARRCGRRPRRSRARPRGVGRARARGGRRRALPPRRAAGGAGPVAWPTRSRCSMTVAADRGTLDADAVARGGARARRASTRSCRCATPSSTTSRRRSPPT